MKNVRNLLSIALLAALAACAGDATAPEAAQSPNGPHLQRSAGDSIPSDPDGGPSTTSTGLVGSGGG